jgi:hypothetical protein
MTNETKRTKFTTTTIEGFIFDGDNPKITETNVRTHTFTPFHVHDRLPNRFEELLTQFNLLPKYDQILTTLREGTSLGITPLAPNSNSFFPPNNIEPELEHVVDDQIGTWLAENKIAGPFRIADVLATLGPAQSSPNKLVEKSTLPGRPIRWRVVEDDSFPHKTPKPHELPSLNSDLDPDLFPAHYNSFEEIEDHFRAAAAVKTSRELDLDKKAAFEVIPIHPSVRHRLIIMHRDEAYIRKNAPFGLRTTPGAFCQLEECTIELLHAQFDNRVRAINAMDDLTITIFDPSITDEEVINFIESLGWILNRDKTQWGSRSVVYFGLRWDLDTQTKTLPDPKQEKYALKIETELARGTTTSVDLETFESLLGSLQYLARILPETRPHLRLLYRFRNSFDSRLTKRKYRQNEIRELKYWKSILARDSISSSFAPAPDPFEGTFACDASNLALGIFIETGGEKMTASFSLSEDWRNKFEGAYIGNAEAWAVEGLLEAIVRLGGGGHSVTILCDNTNVVEAWSKGWSRNVLLNSSLLRIFQLLFLYKIRLYLQYIPSEQNPADEVSRSLPFDVHSFPDPSLRPNAPPGTRNGPDPFSTTTKTIESKDSELPNTTE